MENQNESLIKQYVKRRAKRRLFLWLFGTSAGLITILITVFVTLFLILAAGSIDNSIQIQAVVAKLLQENIRKAYRFIKKSKEEALFLMRLRNMP